MSEFTAIPQGELGFSRRQILEATVYGAGALALGHILNPAFAAAEQQDESVEARGETIPRFAGSGRIETAIAYQQRQDDVRTLVLARADKPADALPFAPWANQANSSLLVVPHDEVPGNVMAEIAREFGGQKHEIVLAGKEGAISSNVEQQLIEEGYTVHRRGGDDRFETAAGLSFSVLDKYKRRIEQGEGLSIADFSYNIASGSDEDWAFAATASAYSARRGAVLYSGASDVHNDYIASAVSLFESREGVKPKVNVFGSKAAAVADALGIEVNLRFDYDDPLWVNAAYLEHMKGVKQAQAEAARYIIASAQDFPDGLVASTFFRWNWQEGPVYEERLLVLTPKDDVNPANIEVTPENAVIIGGTAAVTEHSANMYAQAS